jgi:hypothetical protein
MKKIFFSTTILLFAACMNSFAQLPGDIIVTEFLADPSVVPDATGEWLEIYNTTGVFVDINGWHLKDNGVNDHVISAPGSLVVFPGGVITLAASADVAVNGGFTPDYVYSGFNLANSSDEIIFTDASGNIIDEVDYTGTTTGKSWSLDATHLDALLNDNFAFWCLGSTAFGAGDLGTPGQLNPTCNFTGISTASVDNFNIYSYNSELFVMLKSVTLKTWNITDVTGKIIKSGQAQGHSFSIPLSSINKGIYFFTVNGLQKAKKFIVD